MAEAKNFFKQQGAPVGRGALWAAERITEQQTEFAFPKYCSQDECKANSASATLNKWLKLRVSENCVIHSFRHSLLELLAMSRQYAHPILSTHTEYSLSDFPDEKSDRYHLPDCCPPIWMYRCL